MKTINKSTKVFNYVKRSKAHNSMLKIDFPGKFNFNL